MQDRDAQVQGFGLAAIGLAAGCAFAVGAPYLLVHLIAPGGLSVTMLAGGATAVVVVGVLQLIAGSLLGIRHLRRPLPVVVHAIGPALLVVAGLWASHVNTLSGFEALAQAAPGGKLEVGAAALAAHDFPRVFALLSAGTLGLFLALIGALTLFVRRGRVAVRSRFSKAQLIGTSVLAIVVFGLVLASSGFAGHDLAIVSGWLTATLAAATGLLLYAGRAAQEPLLTEEAEFAGVALSCLVLCGVGAIVAIFCLGSGLAALFLGSTFDCGTELAVRHATDLRGCVERAEDLHRLASGLAWSGPLLFLAAVLHLTFTNPAAAPALRRKIVGTILMLLCLGGVVGLDLSCGSSRNSNVQHAMDRLLDGRHLTLPPGIEPSASELGYVDPWPEDRRVVLGRVGQRTLLLGAGPTDVDELDVFKYLKQRLEERPRPSAPYSHQGPYLTAHHATPLSHVLEVAWLVQLLGRCDLELIVNGGPIDDGLELPDPAGRYLSGLDDLPRYLPLRLARGFQVCGGAEVPAAERVEIRIEQDTIVVVAGGQPLLVAQREGGRAAAELTTKLGSLAGKLGDAPQIFILTPADAPLDELVALLNAIQVSGLVRRAGSAEARTAGALAEPLAILSIPPEQRVNKWVKLARAVGIEIGPAKIKRKGKGRGRGKAGRRRGATIGVGPAGIEGSGRGQAAIDRVIAKAGRKIQRCYDRLLEQQPGAGGKIGVRFAIAPDGRVSECKVQQNTVGDDGLGSCAANAVLELRFPKAGRTSQVTHTFAFEDLTKR